MKKMLVVLILFAGVAAGVNGAEQNGAAGILRQAGLSGGLTVVVGCGDPALPAGRGQKRGQSHMLTYF